MLNTLTKEEGGLLLLCQQVGYGDIICSVKDGRLDLREVQVRKCIRCDKEPWKSQYSGSGGEISIVQKRAIQSIRQVVHDAIVRVSVTSGQPSNLDLLYTYKPQAQIA